MKKEITIDIYANYLMITKPEKRKAKKNKKLKIQKPCFVVL